MLGVGGSNPSPLTIYLGEHIASPMEQQAGT
jgi:hypothetical protein